MKKLSLLLSLTLGLASAHLARAGDTPSSKCTRPSKNCDTAASCPSAKKKCHKTRDKSASYKADGKKCRASKSEEAFPVDYSNQNSRAALTRLGAASATQCPMCNRTPCCCK